MKICVIGFSGRMGQAINKLISENNMPHEILYPQKTNTEVENSAIITQSEVIIDFSSVESSLKYLKIAELENKPYILGTTGFSNQENEIINEIAKKIAIVKSGNMSIGINLLCCLVEKATEILSQSFDIAITEAHHKHKKDAPSGTALLLENAIKKANNEVKIQHCSLRIGSIIGEHNVIFSGNNEQLTFSHHAQSREIFAQGALKAAEWIINKPPSLYNMQNVLELK